MDGTRDYCIESTKPLSQRQMPHTLSHGSLGLKNVTINFKNVEEENGKQVKGNRVNIIKVHRMHVCKCRNEAHYFLHVICTKLKREKGIK